MRYKILIISLLLSVVLPSMAQKKQSREHLNSKYTPAKEGLPAYYEQQARALFKRGKWAEGRKMVEEGYDHYGSLSAYNELLGTYWFHYKNYDKARFYYIRSINDDDSNLHSKAMLMKIEELTKHYSTAIVYCNELLEASPYDYTLWKKKIELYRLEGNNSEATRLLQRLAEIYPDKVEVKNEIAWDYERRYQKCKKTNNLVGQEEALRKLVELTPHNADYQMALCNLLLQTGRVEQSMDVAGYAATQVREPIAFVEKKAGILGGMTRYSEALAYIASAEATLSGVRGARINALKNKLEEELARYAAQNDPYTAYARLYEKNHSDEALIYLLNTSMTRGYLDDALMYIREARRRKGDSQNLLYREYTVQRRLGNTRAALALLERIHTNYPSNQEVSEELCAIRMEEVNRQMDLGHYAEAIPMLEKLRAFNVDSDTKLAIEQRLLTCYIQTGQRQKAINQLNEAYSDPARRATMYEEIVTPYIKQLMNEGRLHLAEAELLKVLDNGNPSADILRMAITTALLLKKDKDATMLVEWGRKSYPSDPFFVLKEAQLKAEIGNYADALERLRPMLDEYVGDSIVIGAYVGCCEAFAMEYVKQKRYTDALQLIDEAMSYTPDNKQLILAKARVYEGQKEWKKAIEQYRLYHPSVAELKEYNYHLAMLRRRVMNNAVTIDYQRARPSQEDHISSMATISYSRFVRRHTYTFGVGYAGRDGVAHPVNSDDVEGGNGIQLSGEWGYEWNNELTTTATVSWANKFFPKLRAEVNGSYTLPREWTAKAGLSYRLLEESTSLLSLGLGATKDINRFNLGADLRLFGMFGGQSDGFSGHFFLNGSITAKCYPVEGNKSNLFATASVGNAPEISLIDNSMPVKFNQLNTMLGFGGVYIINDVFDVGLSGQWYNMSVKAGSTTNNSKNYLYLNANVTVHF